jgi:hypothetical protein
MKLIAQALALTLLAYLLPLAVLIVGVFFGFPDNPPQPTLAEPGW